MTRAMAFGRMPHAAPARPMGEINVTPLVDVMLVLVVVFILAAPLLAGSIRLELPQAGQGQPAAAARAVRLALDADGAVYLDDVALPAPALAQRLRRIAIETPEAEIQLRADARVPYGRVVELIDAAQTAGLQRIAFATVPKGAGAGADSAPPP